MIKIFQYIHIGLTLKSAHIFAIYFDAKVGGGLFCLFRSTWIFEKNKKKTKKKKERKKEKEKKGNIDKRK